MVSDQLTSKREQLLPKTDLWSGKQKTGVMKHTVCRLWYFFEGIFTRERLLDIIKNFICFSNEGLKQLKILAGYHQYFAVRKAIESTRKAITTDGKGGVFWHTQEVENRCPWFLCTSFTGSVKAVLRLLLSPIEMIWMTSFTGSSPNVRISCVSSQCRRKAERTYPRCWTAGRGEWHILQPCRSSRNQMSRCRNVAILLLWRMKHIAVNMVWKEK